jgi:type I restriction enzyme S subunit
MSWDTVKLGDIASFSNGINFDKTAYSHGVKLIGVSGFGNRFFPDTANLQEVKKEVVRDSDLLKEGDIVFVRSNGNKELVGRCMLINHITQPITFSGFVIRGRILDTEKYDPVFFTYHFKDIAFRRAMSGTAVGANIQNLSQGRLSAYVAEIPDIDTQHKIANYLSAYDALIENNQKQIKLLEEAAQRLYKEWFVDLRFPGYEDTPIVDGVPEGWEKVGLASIAPVVTGKKDANFGTPDGKYLFFTCAQEPIKAPSYSFDCDAVILAGNGDFNVKLYRGQFEAYQRTYVFSPNETNHLYLLYHAVRESMRQLFQGASGSTIKFLTKRMLEDIAVFIPDTDTLNAFNSTCDAIQQKIECLKAQINDAQEARDRLLPKLMSGEIEV